MKMKERAVWIVLLAISMSGMLVFGLLYADSYRSTTLLFGHQAKASVEALESLEAHDLEAVEEMLKYQALKYVSAVGADRDRYERYLTERLYEGTRNVLPDVADRVKPAGDMPDFEH